MHTYVEAGVYGCAILKVYCGTVYSTNLISDGNKNDAVIECCALIQSVCIERGSQV